MKEPKLRFKADDGAKFPDWEKNNFSDVFDSINNSTFSRDCLNYVDGNVKYIHYGDILTIFDSTVNAEASNVPYVNKDIDCQKYQLLADGDIIVADTAEDDTVGKSVEITNTSNVKMISGLHTIACRPKLKFASGYLGYYMNSNPYHNQLRPYMQGIKVTSISKANIALTNISIPSLLEQQKIASLFIELDTLIQSAEKELEGYRELKQGMLQKMFPKKGEKVPKIRFPEFTGNWEQHKFNEFITLRMGHLFSPSDYVEEGKYNVVTISNVTGERLIDVSGMNQIDELPTNINDYQILKDGDLLISLTGNIGRVSYNCGENNILNYRVGKIEFNKQKIDDKYIYAFLCQDSIIKEFIGKGQGGAQPNISKPEVENLSILVPSELEQKKIGEYFSNLDNLISIQQKELDGYKELKKGLLQQMFC